MPISPARRSAFDILLRVGQQSAYASELLHSERLEGLSAADRGLVTELVMGVLRWQSRLDAAIAAAAGRPLNKVDAEILTSLRLGAYQLTYLSRIPAHAAINESVELVKRARKRSAVPFANAVLRKISNQTSGPEEIPPDGAASVASRFAHPEWLVERWMREFGAGRTEVICGYDQQVPQVSVRIESSEVEQELRSDGIELAPGALLTSARIVVSGDIFHAGAVQEGRVFLQDEASQVVAALVGHGSRLLDCCAAPGGKTAAMASRNPTAEIVAAELHAHRAELLRRRVPHSNVQVIQADALTLPTSGSFDRVLADVPCTGTGTLARNPEIKWRLKADDLADLHSRQVAILRAALRQLSPGGRAVYSTCSLESEENQAVIEEVLSGSVEYKLMDCRSELERLRDLGELAWRDIDGLVSGKFLRTVPGLHPCDGFFAAMIERD